MKFLGVLLIIGGIAGFSEGKFVQAIILLLLGFFILKRLKEEQSQAPTKRKVPTKRLEPSNFVTKYKDYEPIGDEFVALDLETTGLSREYDRIIEISAIKFSGGVKVEEFQTLINPKRKIPARASNINGITNKMVKGKPVIYDVIIDLLNFIGNLPIVAHNVSFDVGFVTNTCKRYFKDDNYFLKNKRIDTVKLSRDMFPDLDNHKLGTVARHLGLDTSNLHRATDDAMLSAAIYLRRLEEKKKEKEEAIANLLEEEARAIEIVKEILIKNDRPIDKLDFRKTQSYFDLTYFSSFARLKLTGRLRYLLIDQSPSEINKLHGNKFNVEASSNSEGDKSRFMITSIEDIAEADELILDSFDSSLVNYHKYLEHMDSRERGPSSITISWP